ncbi:unnamed protein product [Euphydryas editha]|uniref:Uncharacterized protein n=1 Tax=Euphydryas editha TaxID=104508 RepID=A0AAU9UEC0_EUPED|nr:unnamed protein product [Euphydryas editha]
MTSAGTDAFQIQLENRFDALTPTLDINEDFENVVNILRDEGKRFCRRRDRGSKSQHSEGTLELMKKRQENTNAIPSELHQETNTQRPPTC